MLGSKSPVISAFLLLANARNSDKNKIKEGDKLFSLQKRRLNGLEDHEGNLIIVFMYRTDIIQRLMASYSLHFLRS